MFYTRNKLFITIILYFVLFLIPLDANANDVSKIKNIISIFCHEVKCDINEKDLSSFVLEINQDNSIEHWDFSLYKKVVSFLRSQGIFVSGFKVNKAILSKIPLPFLIFIPEKGYFVVVAINNLEGKIELECRTWDQKTIKMAANDEKFYVLSTPLMNVLVRRISKNGSKNIDVVTIYSNHIEHKNYIIKLFGQIINRAKKENRYVIYVDELGLIPKESIEREMRLSGISEKEAFLKIKQALKQQVQALEKGDTIYDSSSLYRSLYNYLAKNKIRSVMEDLDYNLWHQIVSFDEQIFYKGMVRAFSLGLLDDYLKMAYRYSEGFSYYNIKVRDKMFIQQILKLSKNNPNALIVVLRGVGHYGYDESLVDQGLNSEIAIIGEYPFQNNYGPIQLVNIMDKNNVRLSMRKRNILLFCSLPQDLLRRYIYDKTNNFDYATSISNKIVQRLNFEDIVLFADDFKKEIWEHNFKQGKVLSPAGVLSFSYNWFKEHGFIKGEDLKAIQN